MVEYADGRDGSRTPPPHERGPSTPVSKVRPQLSHIGTSSTTIQYTSPTPPPPPQNLTLSRPQPPTPPTPATAPVTPLHSRHPSETGMKEKHVAFPSRSTAPSPEYKRPSASRPRPPSMHSIASTHSNLNILRPHPLIRGQSYSAHAAPSAPLISAAVPAEMTRPNTPPSARYGSPEDYSHGHRGYAERPLHERRDSSMSTISTRSAQFAPEHAQGERTRTLSALSTASLAALANISTNVGMSASSSGSQAQQRSPLAPAAPARAKYISKFPPPQPPGQDHHLYPHPYVPAHQTARRFGDPLKDSMLRVWSARVASTGVGTKGKDKARS